MNLLAFAASNSKHSINKQLITYACSIMPDITAKIIDLNDYEIPLYSEDREQALDDHPAKAKAFYELIGQADALLISFAEHNGSYTAAYKNLFDWASRIDKHVFQNKPMVLLATSPGARGGQSVLTSAVQSAPHFAGIVKASLSIPKFQDVFDVQTNTIVDPNTKQALADTLKALQEPS